MKKSALVVTGASVGFVCAISAIIFYLHLKKTAEPEEDEMPLKGCFEGTPSEGMECIDLFRTVADDCEDETDGYLRGHHHNPKRKQIFYDCVSKKFEIMDKNGISNSGKVNDFIVSMYTKTIIEDVQDFRGYLADCAHDDILMDGADVSETMLRVYQCFLGRLQFGLEWKREKDIQTEQEEYYESQGQITDDFPTHMDDRRPYPHRSVS